MASGRHRACRPGQVPAIRPGGRGQLATCSGAAGCRGSRECGGSAESAAIHRRTRRRPAATAGWRRSSWTSTTSALLPVGAVPLGRCCPADPNSTGTAVNRGRSHTETGSDPIAVLLGPRPDQADGLAAGDAEVGEPVLDTGRYFGEVSADHDAVAFQGAQG